MRRTKKLTLLAILTAAALCMFVLESQLPPLTPIPGIKLGLSNIFTLFAHSVLGAPAALALMLIRIVLGSLITGQVSAMGYSLCGGILSYLVLIVFYRCFSNNQLWILSVFCAIAHNAGQLLLGMVLVGSTALIWYFPALLLAGIVTGSFTGLSCQLILRRLRDTKLLSQNMK